MNRYYLSKYITTFLYLIFNLGIAAFAQNHPEIQNGDFLFQIGKGSEFEKAIISSTYNYEHLNFSHVGVATIENDSIFVFEANPKTGVSKTPINIFIKNSDLVVIGRLKKEYTYTIDSALIRIKSILGKPYDSIFNNNNDAYYCSELIQINFLDNKNNPIFEPILMSFKDKENGEILPYWIEYYKNINEQIPEGELGSNPVNIFNSKKINIIYKF